jgi:DNA primase
MSNIHFSEEYKQQVKGNNPLLEVASEYVNFKEAGSVLEAVCPMHDDNDPSFKYHKDSGQITCYGGCDITIGDSIQFLMEVELMGFQEAMMELINRSGMELPDEDTNEKLNERKKMRKKLEVKSRKFWTLLVKRDKGRDAIKYLKERGITKKNINKWRLGYSDFSEKNNDQFKKFCNRIIFTVLNEQGKTVGFSGRQLPANEDSKYPKYINSSNNDNPLFIKKRIVYGLNFARPYIRKRNHVIWVEGFTDVILLHKLGLKNVVASMGTAITEQQIKKVKKYTNRVILFLDGDDSGQKAMKKSIELFKKHGIDIKLVKGKGGLDPADMAKELTAPAVKKYIYNNAKLPEQYIVDDLLTTYEIKIADAKKELINNLKKYFSGYLDDLDTEIALDSICDKLNITIETLKNELKD